MLPLVWLFVCVILILGLAYFFTKHVVGRTSFGSFGLAHRGMMQVIAQLPLGRDRQVILIRMGERYFLLGSTANEIHLLSEIPKEEVDVWREKERQMGEEGQPLSFKQSLQEILKSGRYRGD